MNTEHILKYLDGQMLPDEEKAFQEKIKTDSVLAKKLSEIKELHSYAINLEKTSSSSAMIKDVGNSFNPSKVRSSNPKSKNNIIRILLPIAVAAMLILGLFIRPLFETKLPDQTLISYEISPLSFQTRSQGSAELLAKASSAFNAQQYSDAVVYLNEIVNADSKNLKAQLYKGVALLRMNENKKAHIVLQELENYPDFASASYFYRGLSYLKTEDTVLAKEMFENISATSSFYTRAQERLTQL